MKVKLRDLVDIFLGITSTPKYEKNGIPFLSVKDVSSGLINFDNCKYISKKEYDSLPKGAKPKVGDMLFCRVGTLGKPIIIPDGTPLFGTFVSLGYLRNKNAKKCNLEYIKYWMNSGSFWRQVESNVRGASQVNLNTGWLSDFNIDLPPIKEQLIRLRLLNKCSDLIKAKKQELEKLDELIKSQFMEMFSVYLKDKTRYKSINQITTFFNDGDWIESKDQSEYGIRLIQTGNIGNGIYLNKVDRARFIDDTTFYKLKCTEIFPNDVLISRLPDPIGRACVVPKGLGKSITSVDCSIVRFKKELIPQFFITYTMTSQYKLQIKKYETGSTRKRISRKNLGKIKIPVPDIKLQEQFYLIVQQINKSKFAIQKSIDELQLLFDSLMQKYFG